MRPRSAPGRGRTEADEPMRILVVNAGSSSLKLRVLDPDDRVVASEDLPAPRGQADVVALARAIGGFGTIDAVGHRIVHGGTLFVQPVRIDREVVERLRALTDLAPLHQPKSLAALAAVEATLPEVPAVACFDTAFHATMPAAAATYAIPPEWRKRWDLRKFGFHGLSHAYASRRAAELIGGTIGPRPHGHLPSRGGGVARRRARRPLGRHHHGIYAARRPGHGHPVREHRSGPGPVAGRARADATGRACGHPRAPVGVAGPGWNGGHAGDPGGSGRQASPTRSSPSTSITTGCGARSPRWRRRSAVSTSWSSPVGWGRTRPRSGSARRVTWRSSASAWTRPATALATPIARSGRPARRCARS